MVTVDCVLTQGAWHVLRRDNPHDGTGVDITKSPWYTMVRLMLRREEVTRGGYVGMKLTDGVAGKLYVTLDDVRRLGHYISTENMAHLSCAITGRELRGGEDGEGVRRVAEGHGNRLFHHEARDGGGNTVLDASEMVPTALCQHGRGFYQRLPAHNALESGSETGQIIVRKMSLLHFSCRKNVILGEK